VRLTHDWRRRRKGARRLAPAIPDPELERPGPAAVPRAGDEAAVACGRALMAAHPAGLGVHEEDVVDVGVVRVADRFENGFERRMPRRLAWPGGSWPSYLRRDEARVLRTTAEYTASVHARR
jgi:hypothetical protein